MEETAALRVEMLKWALAWVQRWMKSSPNLKRREILENLTTFTFAEIKTKIRKEYDRNGWRACSDLILRPWILFR